MWGIFDATTSPRCAIGVVSCAWVLTRPSWKLPLRLRDESLPRGGAGRAPALRSTSSGSRIMPSWPGAQPCPSR
jgi:hypothetical protein